MVYKRVKVLLKEKKVEEALRVAVEAYKKSPKDSNINMAVAIAMSIKGNKENAFKLLYRAIKLNPLNANAYANRAIINYKDKHYYEAKVDAKKALELNPNLDETRRMLTKLYYHHKEYDSAIECFLPYLAKYTNDVNSYILLGEIYTFHKDYEKALEIYKDAININNNALVWFYKAVAYMLSEDLKNTDECLKKSKYLNTKIEGDIITIATYANLENNFEKAIAFSEAILRLNPRSIQPYSIITKAYANLGDNDKAEEYYKIILNSNINTGSIRNSYASFLITLGRKDEAIEELKNAFQGNGEDVYVYNQLAPLINWTPDNPYIDEMKKLLDSGTLIDKEKGVLNFALATIYENLAKYSRSFTYLNSGNKLVRDKIEDKDINTLLKQTDVLKSVFTKEFLSQNIPNQPMESAPIFILGTLRSGSTLVETILSCHSEVYASGEIETLNESFSKYFFGNPNKPFPHNLNTEKILDFAKAGDEYINSMKQLAKDKKYYTDKLLGNYKWIGFIKLMLPNAKIIHTKRDPLDSCLSMYKQNFKSDSLYYTFDLKELGLFYKSYVDMMNHWNSVLPNFIHEISYEDLISNQEEESRKLVEFCGLEWEDGCLQFHKSSRQVETASRLQVRKPIYKSSVKKWKHYEKELQPLIEILKDENII